MEGGLSKTQRAASLDSFLLPAKSRPHESGMVTMLAAARVMPTILLGAYHGMRLWWI